MVTQRYNVTTASGDQVNVTGTLFTISLSAQAISVSGQPVSISGQPITLQSGTIVIGQSGLNVVVQSGVNVVGNFTASASVSGQPVALTSGTIVIGQSGLNVVVQSGLPVIPPAVIAVRARAIFMVTAASGGATLNSGVVTGALIKSMDGDIYLGGTSDIDMPYSGYGILIQQGDTLSMPAANFNQINVCATISGNRIWYGGVN